MASLSQNSPQPLSGKRRTARGDDPNNRFNQRLDQVAADTERLLDQLLAPKPNPGELARPARLLDAMRYSSLGGGKRIRPFLVVESAKLLGVPRRQALMVA